MGLRDPRPLLLAGLVLTGALAAYLRRDQGTLAAGVTLLSPALATGLALGAPDALVLGGMLAAVTLARRGRAIPAGIVGGVATSGTLHVHTLPATIPLVQSRGGDHRFVRVLLGSLLVTFVLVILVGRMVDGRAWPESTAAVPGVGLGGLLAYRGVESSAIGRALQLYVAPLAVLASFFLASRRIGGWLAAAIVTTVGLWFWGSSALWLAAPITLLTLGALEEAGDA